VIAPPRSSHTARTVQGRALWLGAFASLALGLVILGAGTGCTPPPRATAADLARVEEDTSLGTGDVFEVRVYGETDLSADYRVAQNGEIDFPLIGTVHVAGLEPGAVAAAIATALRDGQFLVDPHVSVIVREYNSKRVSVLGAVRNPGNYPLRSGMGVVEAVSLAGGFTSLANRDGTVITRTDGDETRRISAPVDRITGGSAADVPVRAGDIITVPERLF
jgi:protein involved in polysaccharide export with SLBB domain